MPFELDMVYGKCVNDVKSEVQKRQLLKKQYHHPSTTTSPAQHIFLYCLYIPGKPELLLMELEDPASEDPLLFLKIGTESEIQL